MFQLQLFFLLHCDEWDRVVDTSLSQELHYCSYMATGSDLSSRDPFGVPLGVPMRNRKLHNIRPSGAFSPEMPLEVLSMRSASIIV